MPVAGLSEALDNMLSSVLKSHELRNWTIFEDNGNITFKIRFNVTCQGQSNSTRIAYRRKSENQIKRDQQRAVKRQRKASPGSSPETERLDSGNSEDFLF